MGHECQDIPLKKRGRPVQKKRPITPTEQGVANLVSSFPQPSMPAGGTYSPPPPQSFLCCFKDELTNPILSLGSPTEAWESCPKFNLEDKFKILQQKLQQVHQQQSQSHSPRSASPSSLSTSPQERRPATGKRRRESQPAPSTQQQPLVKSEAHSSSPKVQHRRLATQEPKAENENEKVEKQTPTSEEASFTPERRDCSLRTEDINNTIKEEVMITPPASHEGDCGCGFLDCLFEGEEETYSGGIEVLQLDQLTLDALPNQQPRRKRARVDEESLVVFEGEEFTPYPPLPQHYPPQSYQYCTQQQFNPPPQYIQPQQQLNPQQQYIHPQQQCIQTIWPQEMVADPIESPLLLEFDGTGGLVVGGTEELCFSAEEMTLFCF